jgi:hypothetical protein
MNHLPGGMISAGGAAAIQGQGVFSRGLGDAIVGTSGEGWNARWHVPACERCQARGGDCSAFAPDRDRVSVSDRPGATRVLAAKAVAVSRGRSGHDLGFMCAFFVPLMRDPVLRVHVGDERCSEGALSCFPAGRAGHRVRRSAHAAQFGKWAAVLAVIVI